VSTKEEWERMVYGSLTVSHICHNSNCREPEHILMEDIEVNLSRNTCQKQTTCECSNSPRCLLAHIKTETNRLQHHWQAVDNKDLNPRCCPLNGCNWQNPISMSLSAKQIPKHTRLPTRAPKPYLMMDGYPKCTRSSDKWSGWSSISLGIVSRKIAAPGAVLQFTGLSVVRFLRVHSRYCSLQIENCSYLNLILKFTQHTY